MQMWWIAGLQRVNKNSNSSKTKTQIVSAHPAQNYIGKSLVIETAFTSKWTLTTGQVRFKTLCMF